LKRSSKLYLTEEVLTHDQLITIMDVNENHWLLEHSHDFPEIIYVLEGKGTHYINGEAFQIQENEIYIIPIGTTHVFRPHVSAKALRVRDVIFRSEWLAGLLNSEVDTEMKEFIHWLLGKPSPSYNVKWLTFKDHEIIIRRKTDEIKALIMQHPPLVRTRLFASILELLAILCLSSATDIFQQAISPDHASVNTMKQQILEALKMIPLNKISAKKVAATINVSERHLSRLFVQNFGMSYQSYIQQLRLEESMRLLNESNLTIKEIVNHIGLQDTDYFSAMFRKKLGIKPSQFRRINFTRVKTE
jgi:AraC-like DNA-binding protein